SRSFITYSWYQRRAFGAVARTSSMDVVPRVPSVNGMPAAAAAPAPAISPSVCMSRVKPIGGDPERQVGLLAEHGRRRIEVRDVVEDPGMEFDVLERLPRPRKRDLTVGGAVGVVERGLRGASFGDLAQVGDRIRAGQAVGAEV